MKWNDWNYFYLKCNSILLADAFEKFRKIGLEVYEIDPVKFVLAPGLAWQAALKKTKVELEQLADIDMLLMVEIGIRGGTYYSINKYGKADTKYMKDFKKIRNCHI